MRQTALVIGRPLAEAERVLVGRGAVVLEVRRTEPPGRAPSGPLRVVRERWENGGVRLLAAASVEITREKGADF
jgi:hypothetical protein